MKHLGKFPERCLQNVVKVIEIIEGGKSKTSIVMELLSGGDIFDRFEIRPAFRFVF